MSMLSRTLALPATHEVATAVAALLSDLGGGAPPVLGGNAAPTPAAPEAATPDVPSPPTPDTPAPTRILGPRGLGTATLLFTAPVTEPGSTVPPFISTTASAPPSVQTTGTAIPTAPSGSSTRTTRHNNTESAARAGVEQPAPSTSSLDLARTPPVGRSTESTGSRIPTGPTGLGSASARRTTGGSAIPPLYCPPPMRDDPVLAAVVNERILAWATSIGLYEGRLDDLRDAGFGRLIMLAHPDCDDPDRLLAAAKCAVAEWSVDDYYCDAGASDTAPDGTPSSAEAELGPRLELAAAAIDPVHLPARYAARVERALQADPILRAFRSGFAHLAQFSTPAQLGRLRTEIAGWFIALGAEAGWRQADRTPQAWEYLANRQPHSFLPCMAPIDTVGGYELQAAEYTDPRVRRVITTAALASQLVNDLYSMAREDRSDGREFNLPTVLVAAEGCTRREAVLRTAELHDELMHRVEAEAAPLAAAGSAELRRFLTGVWAWLGGSRAWHAESKRYADK
ncbi:family 2 encapsulin nanocompartment cargo protein terpene cyclase [Nocardia sp. NPDC051756]|uniref:family 2 encapsulin nanocompartment cargo protein terpene cyclase n=1 Tax=Nocardia sp. NPDC051756 TaxID=3154751 RepID=UPI00343B29F6